MTHLLKCKTEYFQAIFDGVKKFEIRKNDRDFKIGDIVILIEIDDNNNEIDSFYKFEIKYILHGPCYGIEEGYCIINW